MEAFCKRTRLPDAIDSHLGESACFLTCNLLAAPGGQLEQIHCVDEDTEAGEVAGLPPVLSGS